MVSFYNSYEFCNLGWLWVKNITPFSKTAIFCDPPYPPPPPPPKKKKKKPAMLVWQYNYVGTLCAWAVWHNGFNDTMNV